MFPAILARERAAAASPEASNTTSHDACMLYVFTPTMSSRSRRVGAGRAREVEPERERLNPRAYALNMTKSRNAYIQCLHAAPTYRTASQPPTTTPRPSQTTFASRSHERQPGPGERRLSEVVLVCSTCTGGLEITSGAVGSSERAGCCLTPRTYRSLLQPRNPVPFFISCSLITSPALSPLRSRPRVRVRIHGLLRRTRVPLGWCGRVSRRPK
ncbi:hypothetical protein K466DRAFT_337746 [Polyporus arcularius HHB13444]|uniref:Uncharacterized protein n=1 Tax=Polyporus arcularius HHB13444 TaxID=1314778 RepID=A0A5C3PNB5_9APHY|nr:hypothetical protein K466DRAFT_337746 [Polyporus arcularius HHB13444]